MAVAEGGPPLHATVASRDHAKNGNTNRIAMMIFDCPACRSMRGNLPSCHTIYNPF